MLAYLFLCLISFLTGLGILKLIKVDITNRLSLLLAPILALSFWAICIGIGISFEFTMKELFIPLWILTLLIASLGVKKTINFRTAYIFSSFNNATFLNKNSSLKKDGFLLVVIIGLPIVLMAHYFWHGLINFPGSSTSDGWAYVAYGQYLWQYPRGTEGSLAPLYQYAVTLAHARFIASSLLGFFSFLTFHLGETEAAASLFQAWGFFVYTSAVAFFIFTQRFSYAIKIFYIALVIFSSWSIKLLWANNYDNILILGMLPVLAGISSIIDFNNKKWAFILGILSAATIYCYPEMAPFIFLGGLLLLLNKVEINKEKLKVFLIIMFIMILTNTILVSPVYKNMVQFFLSQAHLAIGNQIINNARPGEGMFPELIQTKPFHILNAFWGLRQGSIGLVCAAILTFLMLFGARQAYKNKNRGLLYITLLFLCFTLIMIAYFKYDYGAYKLILLNWWLIVYLVITAISKITLHNEKYFKNWILIFLSAYFVINFYNFHILMKIVGNYPIKNITAYRNLESLKSVVENKATIVAVNDDLSNVWAVYFLRSVPIKLLSYHGYMADNVPYMLKAAKISDSNISYFLTDYKDLSFGADLVWSSGPYYLWKINSNSIFIASIQNPNGIENWEGKQGFWVNNKETQIQIFSEVNGEILISAEFKPGPSVPENNHRDLLLQIGMKKLNIPILKDSTLSFIVPIKKGSNLVTLYALDSPTLLKQKNGDARIMLVGIENLHINNHISYKE